VKPRTTASLATSSAMCSQGNGERGTTWAAPDGQISKSAPIAFSLWAEASISSLTPAQSLR
jgi:hypothetical protein